MNFLAHIYLSGNHQELTTGNFIADFVKGSKMHDFSPGIIKGIELHRMIDRFTDGHPIVREGKARLAVRYKKYSHVIIDIFYDHFLAAGWKLYSEEKLEDFAARFYAMMQKQQDILPERLQQVMPYIIRQNWLVSYRRIEGIQQALNGMSRRATFESGMETATEELVLHYDLFRNEFNAFFPELIAFSKTETEKLFGDR